MHVLLVEQNVDQVLRVAERPPPRCYPLRMESFLLDPARAPLTPIVASVPHSGTDVPPDILERLDPGKRHLPDTDWHVDRLFDFLPDLGVTVLRGTHSRYVADLNRALTEPLVGTFSGSVVAAESFAGEPLYDTPPDADEARRRLDAVYHPFHDRLQALLDERIERFGRAFLLDLHSFDTVIPEDVCLGDDEGRLRAEVLMPALYEGLRDDFDTVRNKVWTGGHISIHYGSRPRIEAIQFEINHAAYLAPDEIGATTTPSWRTPRFEATRRRLADAFPAIVERIVAS